MKVSFNGCGNQVVTFLADGKIKEGSLVKVTDNGTVSPSQMGDEFIGVAVSVDGEFAAVCISGFVNVKCMDTDIVAGYVSLAADNNGGISANENGKEKLVVNVDEAAKTATILL